MFKKFIQKWIESIFGILFLSIIYSLPLFFTEHHISTKEGIFNLFLNLLLPIIIIAGIVILTKIAVDNKESKLYKVVNLINYLNIGFLCLIGLYFIVNGLIHLSRDTMNLIH